MRLKVKKIFKFLAEGFFRHTYTERGGKGKKSPETVVKVDGTIEIEDEDGKIAHFSGSLKLSSKSRLEKVHHGNWLN